MKDDGTEAILVWTLAFISQPDIIYGSHLSPSLFYCPFLKVSEGICLPVNLGGHRFPLSAVLYVCTICTAQGPLPLLLIKIPFRPYPEERKPKGGHKK